MEKIRNIFVLTLVIAMFIVSCVEDAPEINTPISAEQINLEVTQPSIPLDSGGGNTVVLRNRTEGVISFWDFGIGKSQKQVDTVRFAFAGTYTIKRKALTGGRLVDLPDLTVEVTKTNTFYLSDPVWSLLSGGPNQERTWVWDLDENNESKHFDGPVYFIGENKFFNPDCQGSEPNCWEWSPTWQNWMGSGDYGSMTFSLKGGPYITVDQKIISGGTWPGGQSGVFHGTYALNEDGTIITFDGAYPINNGWDQDFTTGHIVSLTDSTMQLAFKSLPKAEYEIYNYIVKP
jgi:hypothetical protein